MKGVAIVAGIMAAGSTAIVWQADRLARMVRVELGRNAGKDGAPVAEATRAQWSGMMQAAVNRAVARKQLPSQVIEQRRGEGRAVWTTRLPEYLLIMDRLGPTTPVPGVYAAGAHATPGSGVHLVGLSAALVAQSIGPA